MRELLGRPVGDVWTDISPINSQAGERLGYPTQKPLALLERIIQASSNEGDVVLDPFCGCGTAVDAAQQLGRRWLGIDITYLAVDLIDKRLRHRYGEEVAGSFKIEGIPTDEDGARSLFNANPFDFERWAVSLVDGTPNQKQVGDKGIDGVIGFPLDNKGTPGRVLISVKGGRMLNPGMLRDLVGTVESQRAEMGVLITMEKPTAGVVDAARHSGAWTHPSLGRNFPKVQVITVGELLRGLRPEMPQPWLPYIQAQKFIPDHPQLFKA